MEESRSSGLTADGCASGDVRTDITKWTNNQDSDSHKIRSDIISEIMNVYDASQRLTQLRIILNSGWDANEILDIQDFFPFDRLHRTALLEAVRKRWTEGVKLLLDAGATCTMSDGVENPLVLAIRCNCPVDLIQLLLKHGADPNNHDDQYQNVPLLNAIGCWRYDDNGTIIVQLLLEHGANPGAAYRASKGGVQWVERTALYEAIKLEWTEVAKMLLDAGAECTTPDASENPLALALQKNCPPDLIERLLTHGADPNHYEKDNGNALTCAIQNTSIIAHILKITELLLEHGANPNMLHRVDVGDDKERKWVHRTALHVATSRGWTDVVKMLLDAGARCVMPGALENPLMLAFNSKNCSTELIELLLKNGSDPNYHTTDRDLPLPHVISSAPSLISYVHLSTYVQLLLEHGADPNVRYKINMGYIGRGKSVYRTALMLAVQNNGCSMDVMELLVKHGADVNYAALGVVPLLQRLCHGGSMFQTRDMFLQQQLDLFFLHGGNVNMEDSNHRTALEYAIREAGHSNSVRWLIRHGADTSPIRFTGLKRYFISTLNVRYFPQIPLILLQAGMWVSRGVQVQLSSMEAAITTWLQEDTGDYGNITRTIQGMLGQLQEADEEEPQQMHCHFKSTFLQQLTSQMVDLEGFSDGSLHLYPEDTLHGDAWGSRDHYQNTLDEIHRVLEFLSETQSLQWHCRRCVRENLVSLQPSVVKTLRIPARLKCYVLCHEI